MIQTGLTWKTRNYKLVQFWFESVPRNENDKFNLYGDDSLQRKRFHDKEDVDLVDIIKQLFDDISSEQAVDFYRIRTNLK